MVSGNFTMAVLTSLDVFLDGLFLLAGSRLLRSLGLQFAAHVVAATCVEGPLQSVALPAEDVVAVPSVADADEKKGNQTS